MSKKERGDYLGAGRDNPSSDKLFTPSGQPVAGSPNKGQSGILKKFGKLIFDRKDSK